MDLKGGQFYRTDRVVQELAKQALSVKSCENKGQEEYI